MAAILLSCIEAGHLAVMYRGRTIAPPGFYSLLIAPSNFVRCVLPFLHGLQSCTHLRYHMAMIICANRAKSGGAVIHPPCTTVKMAAMPIALHRRDSTNPFKFLGYDIDNIPQVWVVICIGPWYTKHNGRFILARRKERSIYSVMFQMLARRRLYW